MSATEIAPSQQGLSSQQVEIDRAVRARVLAGIELLKKEHGDDWVEKIDMESFDITSGSSCILGQLYSRGQYDDNAYCRGIKVLDISGIDYGFEADEDASDASDPWDELQLVWEEELKYLKGGGV